MHPLIVSALRRHLIKHSGEKPNRCNQCDYASSGAGNLRTHLKTHSGEKPNKCNQCDYASSYASALRRHLIKHSGEKPNRCNQCDYASSDAGNLWAHLKHTVEKNHWSVTNALTPADLNMDFKYTLKPFTMVWLIHVKHVEKRIHRQGLWEHTKELHMRVLYFLVSIVHTKRNEKLICWGMKHTFTWRVMH